MWEREVSEWKAKAESYARDADRCLREWKSLALIPAMMSNVLAIWSIGMDLNGLHVIVIVGAGMFLFLANDALQEGRNFHRQFMELRQSALDFSDEMKSWT